jgi:glycosyltransferase involved in cell wall biosynthesis
MRLLFVKTSLEWPRTTGHDVYCYHMMKALGELGAEIALATVEDVDPRAIEGVRVCCVGRLTDEAPGTPPTWRLTPLQERFRSFWGVRHGQIEAVKRTAVACRADVVIVFGLPTLPYLAGVPDVIRVWAMADEWVYHHLSRLSLTDPGSWINLKEAVIKGLYERAYRPLIDRIWVVSEPDRRAARWFAGIRAADLLPNGVDTDFYQPQAQTMIPMSAVFWGRLDFGPNLDALRWFCLRVWPGITRRVPTARFTIIGYAPTPEVEGFAAQPGITLVPNAPDLRAAVCQHTLVVLPFVSGGGIKNKLLEGAALGRPIVCTPQACKGLQHDGTLPMVQAKTASDWVERVIGLWGDEERCADLGRQARHWVSRYYSWSTPARDAYQTFQRALAAREKHPAEGREEIRVTDL